MRAMVFEGVGRPLRLIERPRPAPGPGQVLLRVEACGVCRTDLHLLDGEVTVRELPRVLGHQIVGVDVATGRRIGVPWLGWTCGACGYCTSGRENLCAQARFTGCDIDGGLAEYAVADDALLLPDPGRVLGAAGGAAAVRRPHRLPLAAHVRRRRTARAVRVRGGGAHHRPGRTLARAARSSRSCAREMTRRGRSRSSSARNGRATRAWRPRSRSMPRSCSHPTGALVPTALRALAAGGTLVLGGIHMSDIPSFPYELLWHERSIRSVANLTRARRRRVPRARAASARTNAGAPVPARGRRTGPRRSAGRPLHRRCGHHALMVRVSRDGFAPDS